MPDLAKPGAVLRRHRSLALILLTAFGLRLAWLLHAMPEPVSDYQVYYQLAETLLDERTFGLDGPSALQLPGHPWLLSGLMLISKSTAWLGFVMVLLSTTACFLVYLLALRLTTSETIALVAAGVCAVSPTLVLYGPILGTEHLFAVLMLGALLVTLALRSDDIWRALAAGGLTGFAVLTRGEALFYVPVLMAIIWRLVPARPRARVRLVGLVLAALVVVLTPWVVRNAMVVQPGINLSTVGGMNFYFGHNPDHYGWTPDVPWATGDDLGANRLGWELGLRYLRERPISVIESARDGTYAMLASPDYALFWSTQAPASTETLDFVPRHVPLEGVLGKLLIASAAFSLAVAAMAVLLWRRWSRSLRLVIPGLVLCSWLGHAVLLFGHPRFRYFLDIVLSVLVALTLVTLWRAGSSHPAEHTGEPVG